MKNNQFHKAFRLNGNSFSHSGAIIQFAKTQIPTVYPFLTNWFSSTNCIDVQTSGSTGAPKLISLKKEQMQNSALATGAFFNLYENTSALLCLPPDYIAGKMMLVRALTLGWHLDVVKPTSNVKITKRYDFSAMVPMQLQSSLSDIYRVKKIIIGGGVVSKLLKDKIKNHSTEIFATYGMTETITHIAVKKLNNFTEENKKSFYKIFPTISISVDKRNCLVIKAPKIVDAEVITNDVIRLVSETEFEWLGRFDHVINSGGIKLHPEKIEEKLVEILSQRFFVCGIPDSLLGQRLALIIEGKKNEKLVDTIKKFKKLTKFEVPKAIYFIERFIETDTKKIQRNATLNLID